MELWRVISGRTKYNPDIDEQATYLEVARKYYRPGIYNYNSSHFLGKFFIAFGAILQVMNISGDSSILEYGAGDGQISLALARMGCNVSVIDIEGRYLDLIKAQAIDLGLEVDTMQGGFGDNFPDNRKYDRILFFECFHHAWEHQAVLDRLRNMLKPNGQLVFAGEPIIERDGPWLHCVPYAWGPRLDGLSARAMRVYGWCELGFQRPYFVELLLRNGFSVEYSPCAGDGRGTCYIATPLLNGVLDLRRHILIELHEGISVGWHDWDGTFRWTSAEATLPTPAKYSSACITLSNPLPFDKKVCVSSERSKTEFVLRTGDSIAVEIEVQSSGGRLIINSETHCLAKILGLQDDRDLGVCVSTVTYS